jgi:SAM-dependent methyltransferase
VTRALSSEERAARWDSAYDQRGVGGVSWYQRTPEASLQLIDALRVPPAAAVIDVGGGASSLADHLVRRGYSDVTVLDVSRSALDRSRGQLADPASVSYVHDDLLRWHPPRQYDLWHDRALYHFLVDEKDRQTYAKTLRSALATGGFVIVATFAHPCDELRASPRFRWSDALFWPFSSKRIALASSSTQVTRTAS